MLNPTTEQAAALALFGSGVNMAIDAGAGAGKTSTLKMLAESTDRRGQYLAFNKAIVEEAKAKMPANVKVQTIHSLAYSVVGKNYRSRLNAARVPSARLGRILGLDPLNVPVEGKPKTLQPAFLGSLTMRAINNFCQSADKAPTPKHVPFVPGIDSEGKFGNNAAVRDHLAGALTAAWADLQKTSGSLPFSHAVYLKLYELSAPKINADFILFDEAQDAAPVMESIVLQQAHAQLVVVGDTNQAIYGFTGAVDALAHFKEAGAAVSTLSQSFRFGPAIAATANTVLGQLASDLTLTGTPTIDSTLDVLGDHEVDAILCRSNAGAVTTLLSMQTQGHKVKLLGGGTEVLNFAKAAADIMAGRSTSHPDLACFDTWQAVVSYSQNDPQGEDLRLLVSLVNTFGCETICDALSTQSKADDAVVVSTGHKAKGCEWNRVRLGSDFKTSESAEELRLLYVAVTRAKLVLDVTRCEPLTDLLAPTMEGATL